MRLVDVTFGEAATNVCDYCGRTMLSLLPTIDGKDVCAACESRLRDGRRKMIETLQSTRVAPDRTVSIEVENNELNQRIRQLENELAAERAKNVELEAKIKNLEKIVARYPKASELDIPSFEE